LPAYTTNIVYTYSLRERVKNWCWKYCRCGRCMLRTWLVSYCQLHCPSLRWPRHQRVKLIAVRLHRSSTSIRDMLQSTSWALATLDL